MTYAPPPYVPAMTTPNPTAVMGRRISAALIDLLLPTLIAIAIGAIVWFGNAEKFDTSELGAPYSCAEMEYRSSVSCFEFGNSIWIGTDEDDGGAYAVGFLVWLFVPLNAFVIQGITGATVGKQMLGLRVVRGDGAIASFGWIALRSLMLLVATALNCVCFLGWIAELITASATKRHQRVGDMAAGTFVVLKSSVGSPVDPFASSTPNYQQSTQWSPPPTGASPYGSQASSAPRPWGSEAQAATPAPAQAPAAGSAIPPAWGIQPEPASAPGPTPADATPNPTPAAADPTQPRWDEARQAYIAWEPSRGSWMQHDAATNEWKPI